jgi:hypothetical protein
MFTFRLGQPTALQEKQSQDCHEMQGRKNAKATRATGMKQYPKVNKPAVTNRRMIISPSIGTPLA